MAVLSPDLRSALSLPAPVCGESHVLKRPDVSNLLEQGGWQLAAVQYCSLQPQSQCRVSPSSVIGARPNGPSDDSMNGDRENMICDVLDVGQDNGITVEFWAQF